ncbi:hypothetical protein BCF11_0846 [Collimonas sp. PA-H2]|nr:hypothetical protein BCF11_0846 [Collimonas sp. PA-H2]
MAAASTSAASTMTIWNIEQFNEIHSASHRFILRRELHVELVRLESLSYY